MPDLPSDGTFHVEGSWYKVFVIIVSSFWQNSTNLQLPNPLTVPATTSYWPTFALRSPIMVGTSCFWKFDLTLHTLLEIEEKALFKWVLNTRDLNWKYTTMYCKLEFNEPTRNNFTPLSFVQKRTWRICFSLVSEQTKRWRIEILLITQFFFFSKNRIRRSVIHFFVSTFYSNQVLPSKFGHSKVWLLEVELESSMYYFLYFIQQNILWPCRGAFFTCCQVRQIQISGSKFLTSRPGFDSTLVASQFDPQQLKNCGWTAINRIDFVD